MRAHPAPHPALHPGVRVVDRASAQALVTDALAALAGLEVALERETAHVRAGRLREALADPDKPGFAARYLVAAETVKANAVALARFTPDDVARLRAASRRFQAVVETNQAVLATVRAVSEGLLRDMAAELARDGAPRTYGGPAATPASPYGGRGAPRSEPLVLSRHL